MNNLEVNFSPAESGVETSAVNFEPIMTCVGTRSDFEDTLPEAFEQMRMLDGEMDRRAPAISSHIDNVSWHANDEDKKKAGLISGGHREYVMSPLDSNDKYSSGFFSCLGLIVVGKDKETNKNISIMMHTPLYDPLDDVDGAALENLINSLDSQLKEIQERCLEGSVDSIIVGGLIRRTNNDLDQKSYTRMKDFLSEKVEDVFGVPPVSVAGPKMLRDMKDKDASGNIIPNELDERPINLSETDDIYFENETRRLFLLRPEYTKS